MPGEITPLASLGRRVRGRTPIIATQFEYSLAARDGERDLLPMAEQLGIGAPIYSSTTSRSATRQPEIATRHRFASEAPDPAQPATDRKRTHVIFSSRSR
jgi:aryl-alcohol dehydrogenase-like predicted oxidoreductase